MLTSSVACCLEWRVTPYNLILSRRRCACNRWVRHHQQISCRSGALVLARTPPSHSRKSALRCLARARTRPRVYGRSAAITVSAARGDGEQAAVKLASAREVIDPEITTIFPAFLLPPSLLLIFSPAKRPVQYTELAHGGTVSSALQAEAVAS